MGDIRILSGLDITSFIITEAGANLVTEASEPLLRQLSTSRSFLVVTNRAQPLRTSDTDLPWVYGVKPGGILAQEAAEPNKVLQEDGGEIFIDDINTKSHLLRTSAIPRGRAHG